jgi:hypothetical protein
LILGEDGMDLYQYRYIGCVVNGEVVFDENCGLAE